LIGFTVLALVSGLVVSGLLTTSRTLSSSGSVRAINVEVYWDDLCTQVVSSVDWGVLDPGAVVERTVYVKNSGSVDMNLSMTCTNWVPVEASVNITVAWDREGASVGPGAVLPAVLTMTVSDGISGIVDFSFDIVIEGTG
jgi:hypothetical protein